MSGRGRPQRRGAGRRPARLRSRSPVQQRTGPSGHGQPGPSQRDGDQGQPGPSQPDCGHGQPGPSRRDWWDDGRETRQDATTSSDARTSVPTSGTDPGIRELRERLRFLEDAFEKGAGGHRGHRMDHLSITVAHDVRRKIVEGKSIDLAILLAKSFMDRQEDRQTVAYVLDDQGRLMQISLQRLVPKEEKRGKGEMSLEQWTSAFHIYMSVYLVAHPECLQDMLAYAELIRGAARDFPGNGWLLYDQQFRTVKEADPTRPWGNIDNQLWLQLFCKPPSVTSSLVRSPPAQSAQGGDSAKRGSSQD
ncbi:uncharacterized protein [Littorina saxatilis]|uniref:uncharacterized protein n=1 Tax=Littorina saxatilis TaxID=31220 RepID=UPI0038B65BCC